jgi:hypothetical protein
MWNRSAMVGVVVIIAWLLWMLLIEFQVMRRDFADLRVQVTGIADKVAELDQYGGRAMRDHRAEAHDRAK